MKKKLAILNLYLMSAVLFTILFQSLHTYRHLVADYFDETEVCHHSHDGFSHQHSEDDCSVCDFHFWFYLQPNALTYRFDFPIKPVPYLVQEQEPISSPAPQSVLTKIPYETLRKCLPTLRNFI